MGVWPERGRPIPPALCAAASDVNGCRLYTEYELRAGRHAAGSGVGRRACLAQRWASCAFRTGSGRRPMQHNDVIGSPPAIAAVPNPRSLQLRAGKFSWRQGSLGCEVFGRIISQWWLVSASPRRPVVNPVRAGRQQRQRRCRVPEPELVRAASIGGAWGRLRACPLRRRAHTVRQVHS